MTDQSPGSDPGPFSDPPVDPPLSRPVHDAGPAPDLSPRPFRFTGSAAEYFRIWIVNLVLSIVTLGIYSAWAKVRRLRYFYGHTVLDGSRFGYHASPIAILKGRLIAYAVVIFLAIVGQYAPLFASVFYLPLIVIMPIVLVRALRFRAANSSFRGVRFAFDGQESEAYAVFLGLPIAVPLTLGLLYPFMAKRQREFAVGNSRHGRSTFQLTLPTWPVYRLYIAAAAVGLVVLGAATIIFVGAALGEVITGGGDDPAVPGVGVLAGVAMIYLTIGVLMVAVRTAFENLVWNHTTIDGHRFESRLRIPWMFGLYVTNIVAIAATLGLAVPWARIRLAEYRAESLTLMPGGPIVSDAPDGRTEVTATGAELSEAMDFDFGL